jgi:hypothetical protein
MENSIAKNKDLFTVEFNREIHPNRLELVLFKVSFKCLLCDFVSSFSFLTEKTFFSKAYFCKLKHQQKVKTIKISTLIFNLIIVEILFLSIGNCILHIKTCRISNLVKWSMYCYFWLFFFQFGYQLN